MRLRRISVKSKRRRSSGSASPGPKRLASESSSALSRRRRHAKMPRVRLEGAQRRPSDGRRKNIAHLQHGRLLRLAPNLYELGAYSCGHYRRSATAVLGRRRIAACHAADQPAREAREERRRAKRPRRCIEKKPTSQTIYLGGVPINLTALAISQGLDQGGVSKILSGKRRPSLPYARKMASGLRQADQRLSSTARARLTFSRTSDALAVQTKGFGLSLCLSM